jgi:hypothetical protein
MYVHGRDRLQLEIDYSMALACLAHIKKKGKYQAYNMNDK